MDPNDPTDPEGPKYPDVSTDMGTWFDLGEDGLTLGWTWLQDAVFGHSNTVSQTTDLDNDGLPTWWENYYGLNPLSAIGKNGAYGDPDGDGLPNIAEWAARSNPVEASTLGTGTPDAQVPEGNVRGNVTLGFKHTDGDFMEEKWESANGLSVSLFDATEDSDGDGWDNWSELRTGFNADGMVRSTDPRSETSLDAQGATVAEYPVPELEFRVDYFGSQAVSTNLQVRIVGFTREGRASAPDVTYVAPCTKFPSTYTVRIPESGHVRQGLNSFFVFLDLNGDGTWNAGEPAGLPDEQWTSIGFDRQNRAMHVTLTDRAPMGAVRVDVAALFAAATATPEEGGTDGSAEDETSEPAFVYDPSLRYTLALRQDSDLVGALPKAIVYSEVYHEEKRFLTEADIYAVLPEGLPFREGTTSGVTTYGVYLYPETLEDIEDSEALAPYLIGTVSNTYVAPTRRSVAIVEPTGETLVVDAEDLIFRWNSDVAVRTFDLTITDSEGQVVWQAEGLDCPGADAVDNKGVSRYSYRLASTALQGLNRVNAQTGRLFGNGKYGYTLTLHPYVGEAIELKQLAQFEVALRSAENTDTYAHNGSFFLPTSVRYNGVLLKDKTGALVNKDGEKIYVSVEAHYSASFADEAVAAVSGHLAYGDKEQTGSDAVTIVADMENANGKFWSTRIDAELRALASDRDVYLMAYIDVNRNGKRDAWEPWGYLTEGANSITGYVFDPATATPIRRLKEEGTEAVASFYIQDVDTDNNLEHTSMGGDKTFEPEGEVDPNDPTDPEGPKYPDDGEPDPESPETPDPSDPDGPKDEEGNAVSTWFDYDPDSPVTDTPQTSVGASWLKTVVYAQSNALRDTDFDNDGLPTWWENYYGLDPQSDKGENGPYVDADVDGLPNFAEFRARANPLRASTLGTGTPDAQVPQWNTRGAPTLGLLYTDGDFMEEKWEAKNGVSVDQHDAALDPDADGWSNWAEVRAALSPDGKRTAPTYAASATAGDDYPRPSLTLKADYFEALTVTNATLVIQGFADSTGGGAPDVVFSTPYLGNGALHTVQVPIAGHLREGKNNFFIFLDLNGNGAWDEDEPAGVPDQHDVDIGFDTTGTTLHTALTRLAPPGSVRVNVKPILDQLVNEAENGTVESVDGSSLMNPSTGKPLDPTKFPVGVGMNYYLLLTPFENIAGSEPSQNSEVVVYKELYNSQKPYLTENDIFAASASGLPGTEAKNQLATSYKVWLVPENVYNAGGSVPTWTDYNIAVVTNYFGRLDEDNAAMVSPKGGAVQNNPELTFEWKSNVQVPTFTLKIQKIRDASGASITSTEVYNATVRGVSPAAMEGSVSSGQQQYRYRYTLPRGVGELSPNGATLFGNGSYTYTLSLNPYNGTSKVLEGAFNIGLNDSATPGMSEGGANYKVADSYYVRTKIRYNGVLTTDEDFDGARIIVEAYRTPAFVGNPTAAVSDLLVHDADNAEVAKLNPYVVMSKDRKILKGGKEQFWSTAFDVEIRGLPSADPIYLMAYFDLNGNGQRDVWEPWGYAYTGAASLDGYYYDPVGVQPRLQGSDIAVEFYVQDVDTDSDKLADSWEWLQGRQSGQDVTGDFSKWCDNYIGGSYVGGSGVALWTTDANGNRALTAYGAQLFGLRTYGVDATSGAVSLSEDASENALLNTLDPAAIGQLQGADFNIAVSGISVADERLNLSWKLMATSAPASTGRSRARAAASSAPADVTETVANAANDKAVYAVRGKVNLSDEKWDLLKTIPVGGESTPSITCEGKEYRFFKVDYQPSAKAAEAAQ